MSRSKHHVDRKRNVYGNAYLRARVRELERANRRAPVVSYYVDSPTFIVYIPRRGRGGAR